MKMDEDKISPEQQLEANQNRVEENLSFRMANTALAALRAQNPFLPIVQFPNSTVAILLAAGVAKDIQLPEGTKYIFLSGSNEYYVTRQGRAQIPADSNGDYQSGAFSNPEGFFLYVEEVRNISIVAVNEDTRVTIACYQQM
jgi:hypothetical protein